MVTARIYFDDPSMNKLIREPLLHFLVAGALLFGAWSWMNRGGDAAGGDNVIRITDRELNWVIGTFTKQWQRPPDEREMQGLVAEYLREELLVREARALELDAGDTIVRRRLAQKMTFFLEDTARIADPTDAELRAAFAANPARYQKPARVSFEQVYFSTSRRGERAAKDVLAAVASMNAGRKPADLGDTSLLPPAMEAVDEASISGQFGLPFAKAVATLAPVGWQGPVESEFGLHAVRIVSREEGSGQTFEDVRQDLIEDWRRERETATRQAYLGALIDKYEIQASDSVKPLLEPVYGILRGEPK